MAKQLLLTIMTAVLLSTSTSTARSRFTRQTQSCGCGVQQTIYVLSQATSLPALTPSDLVALNYVIQVLSNPNLTTSQIRSAIALAYANTLQPVDAAQQVNIAIQGLTAIQQYLQSSLLPIATTFRYQVSQSIAILIQYQQTIIMVITNGGATPITLPTIGSLPGTGTVPTVPPPTGTAPTAPPPTGTVPTVPTRRPITLPTIASIHTSHEHTSAGHTSHEHVTVQIG